MSARELDRFRRAQERFESQQEANVAEMAQERRERDDDDDRDLRPGRGTEDRVVEREPSPEPEPVDTVEPRAPPERPPRAGSQIEPSTEPEPEPEPIELPEVDVREELEQASETIRGEFEEAPPDIANIGEVIATGAEPEFIEPGGFRTGAVQAAGTIADVPGTALGLEAIGRFGADRIGEVATGEADTAIQTTTETAERAISEGIRAFEEEPVRLGTQLVGSLALSAGAFGAASAVGPRAGTAARFAIQPGEEILGRGGFAETETLLVESERLRGEVEEELMIETEPFIETELELQTRLRTELDFFQEAEADGIGVEVTAPTLEIAELETELPIETELIGEIETEVELARELLAEAELEQELELARELELQPRREVEPLGIQVGTPPDDVEPIDVSFRGVRTIEAELRPTELDLE